jgi:hypothetical protein
MNLAGVISRPSFWREPLELFKINFLIFKFLNYFSTQEHLAKGFFLKYLNLPRLHPSVGIISIFPLETFLILLPAYVQFGFNILGFHCFLGTIPFS